MCVNMKSPNSDKKSSATQKVPVGFIGTGVMGQPIVKHLLHAGHSVWIHNRSEHKTGLLKDEGAEVHSISEIAVNCNPIFTMVGFPTDVLFLYTSPEGILSKAPENTILIDLTTSKPSIAQKNYELAKKKKLYMLDAPVTGGEVGAHAGTLTILVGGEHDAFQLALPYMQTFGKYIHHLGPAGSGQYTKLCNQIAIASTMMGVCEALAFAEKTGLNAKQVLESLETGAAGSWSLSQLGPKMLDRNFAPGFYVKHFLKDMEIALDCAEELGCHFPGLELSYKLYRILKDEGGEDEGTQALYRIIKNFAL